MENESQRHGGEAMFAQRSDLVNREGGFCKQLQKFQAAAIKSNTHIEGGEGVWTS